MTKREFYNAIISMNSVPAEMKEEAADLIVVFDAVIFDFFVFYFVMLISEVAAALEISTAKASSLLLQLANES